MDFGDILDQWDRTTGRGGRSGIRKKALPREADSIPSKSFPADALRAKAAPEQRRAAGRGVSGNAALIRWLSEHEVPDKDRNAGQDSNGASGTGWRGMEAAEQRRRLRAKKADAALDMHGLTRNEAWTRLETFFETARREGYEKVLIIHGKGNHSPGDAVLKDLVRTFIERCPLAGESGHAGKHDGGSGTTWVLLKGESRA